MTTFYLRLFNRTAINFDFDKEYTKAPLFEISKWRNETIIDISFCRVVYTPDEQQNGHLKNYKTGYELDERRDKAFSVTTPGITKH